MADENAILLVLSNAVSADREAEFNEWYNNVHCNEVTNLPGFTNVARYRVIAQVNPPDGEPAYRYLALFELNDPQLALQSLSKSASEFKMSTSIDLAGSQVVAFEKIYPVQAKKEA